MIQMSVSSPYTSKRIVNINVTEGRRQMIPLKSTFRSKMLHIIPEEAPEDEGEEEDKPGNSEEGSDEFSDDDIEDLLARQQAPKTQ